MKYSSTIYIVLICYLFLSCDDTIINTSMNCNDIYNDMQLESFNLEDLNPNSSSYSYNINLDSYSGRVRLFYFSTNEN